MLETVAMGMTMSAFSGTLPTVTTSWEEGDHIVSDKQQREWLLGRERHVCGEHAQKR
jgi:hypothetical protein